MAVLHLVLVILCSLLITEQVHFIREMRKGPRLFHLLFLVSYGLRETLLSCNRQASFYLFWRLQISQVKKEDFFFKAICWLEQSCFVWPDFFSIKCFDIFFILSLTNAEIVTTHFKSKIFALIDSELVW